jgi:phosphoglycerate dehydrogenase-like enzyme
MRANVLVFVTIPPQGPYYRKALQEKDPELTVQVALGLEDAIAAIPDADIFMGFGANLSRDFFQHSARLKWVHALGTGVDGITDSPWLARDVVVTATRGIHGVPMSEAALMMMLGLARDFRRTLAQQEQRKWERFFPQLLFGKTVGILGIGLIAEDLGPRCKALGMTVVGISRTARAIPGFDRICGREDLERVAAELDFLVLLIPYDKETRHIVGARVLAAMKPTSFVINLARGGVVDEDALLAALEERRIAAAALDAFEQEPLPPDSPLWGLPNAIVSPHMTGTWDGYAEACFKQFAHNYDCFVAGTPDRMLNREARGT